jgi:amidase
MSDSPTLSRRHLLAGLGAAAALGSLDSAPASAQAEPANPAGNRGPHTELEEATVADLQAKMTRGELSAVELTTAYLARIVALDRTGPTLRSVIEINPDSGQIARELDRERREKGPRGPLHGIPVLIKDNIDTADGMLTTAGSLAMAGTRPTRDAHVAARLRAAGAVILGKTNLSEWANFRSTRSTSGWSGRGGQTRNPYALDRNPCGSSSGSGVAAAANLAAITVGTETDGSIVCPSTTNGIVGIKPTLGLVSRAGIIPIAHSQDTPGPMCRTVADAAVLLAALAGPDPRDTTGLPGARFELDFTGALGRKDLRGRRIGVVRSQWGLHPEIDRLADAAVATLKQLGAEVIDPVELPEPDGKDEGLVLRVEFKADLEAYLATRPPGSPRTLAELIAWNEAHRAEEMPWFGQELFEQSVDKPPLTDPAYREARDRNRKKAGPDGIDAALAKHRLDALVAPTGGPAWPTDWINGDHYTGGNSSPAAVAGYPHITVPMGFVHGLPVGFSFLGTAWSDALLVEIAHAFEGATQARRKPEYRPRTVPM